MLRSIISFLVSAGIVYAGAYLLPGITVDTYQSALIVAALLSFVNTFIKPILKFFSTPITFLSLGLFLIVINAVMLLLVEWMMHTFEVGRFDIERFWWAAVLAVFISIASMVTEKVLSIGKDK